MTDDERAAREWLRNKADHRTHPYSDKCRTILALLDRPTLPRPEDLSDEALNAMLGNWFYSPDQDKNDGGMRAAYRALYDHYAQPPAPEPLVRWAVVFPGGGSIVCSDQDEAESVASLHQGSRAVRLVEDRDGR